MEIPFFSLSNLLCFSGCKLKCVELLGQSHGSFSGYCKGKYC